MRVTRLALENWRNFTRVDVRLQQRVFVAGPNAAGKSNLLATPCSFAVRGPRGAWSTDGPRRGGPPNQSAADTRNRGETRVPSSMGRPTRTPRSAPATVTYL